MIQHTIDEAFQVVVQAGKAMDELLELVVKDKQTIREYASLVERLREIYELRRSSHKLVNATGDLPEVIVLMEKGAGQERLMKHLLDELFADLFGDEGNDIDWLKEAE